MFLEHRGLLGDSLNAIRLTGEGVEVGVDRGDFSAAILDRWRGRKLHLVDPYRAFPEGDYPDLANAPQSEMDARFAAVQERFASTDRVHFHRKTSAEAAPAFPDQTLDFAYVDANHGYRATLEDLAAWWPKVRPDGVLCGHDYVMVWYPASPSQADTWLCVKPAVDEFARKAGRAVFLSAEAHHPSFVVPLPKMLAA